MKVIYFNNKLNKEPIRNKSSIIKMIIRACEMIISKQYTKSETYKRNTKLPVYLHQLNRIFIDEENQLFSISFPFKIDLENSKVFFFENQINSKYFAIIRSVIDDFDERCFSISDFKDKLDDNEAYVNLKDEQDIIDKLITFLLCYETGYIRYDDDPETFKKYQNEDRPSVHPQYHFDVNYTDKFSYKIGLYKSLKLSEFIDFFDPKTNCWFIEKERIDKNKQRYR